MRIDEFFALAKKQDSDGLAAMYTDDCILSGDEMRPIIGIEGKHQPQNPSSVVTFSSYIAPYIILENKPIALCIS